MILTFEGYNVLNDGVALEFRPGENTTKDARFTVFLSDAELTTIVTLAQLRAIVISKLQRKVQAAGIASKLDPLVGQSVTI